MPSAAKRKTSRGEEEAAPRAEAPPASAKVEDKPEPAPSPEQPKVIMSHAQRRKLKKPVVVVTAAMKEEAREQTRELRKHLRMLKSNGARRKVAKLRAKRIREAEENEEAVNAFDSDYQVLKKGRRLE